MWLVRMLLPMISVLVIPTVLSSTDTRYLDPVVLTGEDVPSLLGCVECVTRLVAFSWVEGAWSQVPVQVGSVGLGALTLL